MVIVRVLPWVAVVASLLIASCSSDDPSLERRGGPVPGPDGAAGQTATGEAGAANQSGPIPFCDALVVIKAKCQRCHGDPLKNGAPVPFLTYEDTQARYYMTDKKFSDVMLPVIEKGLMPYVALNDPPTSLMPPVEPLTADEKTTLVRWLEQGAKPEGGTDCPP